MWNQDVSEQNNALSVRKKVTTGLAIILACTTMVIAIAIAATFIFGVAVSVIATLYKIGTYLIGM